MINNNHIVSSTNASGEKVLYSRTGTNTANNTNSNNHNNVNNNNASNIDGDSTLAELAGIRERLSGRPLGVEVDHEEGICMLNTFLVYIVSTL